MSETTSQPVLRTRGHSFDLVKAWKLRVLNKLSYPEISEMLGVPETTVYSALQRIQALIPNPDEREAFSSVKPQLLDGVEQQLVHSLVEPERLAKASLNNVAYALTQVHTIRRLEEGKSTENIGLLSKMIVQTDEALFDKSTGSRYQLASKSGSSPQAVSEAIPSQPVDK